MSRIEAAETSGTSGSVPPLGLVGSLVTAAVGLLVSVAAVVVTTGTLARSTSYRAQAQVAITAPETGGNAHVTAFTASGVPAKVASAVLVDRDVAQRATAGVDGTPAISAVVTQDTITVIVTADSAAHAERVAQSVVDIGLPAAAPVVRPLRLVEIGNPAGTAVAAGLPTGLVIAVTAPIGFLLGLLLALVLRWLVGRRTRTPRTVDSHGLPISGPQGGRT